VPKGIEFRVCKRAGDEVEGEVKVREGEVGEEEGDKLVYEFNVEEDLTPKGVVGSPYLTKVQKRVDSGKESTVQPAPSLGYKLWNSILKDKVRFAFH
jgi:hypothetical protein